MEYLSVKETALKWDLTERSIQNYCMNNKIVGAKQIGKQWLIPIDAEKPIDKRYRANKNIAIEQSYHFPLLIFSKYYTLTSELSDCEKILYDAQLDYLKGKYQDAIIKSRNALLKAQSNSTIFGCHLTIAYSALIFGLHTEYSNEISILKKMVKDEVAYKADFELLLAGLLSHVKRSSRVITKLDPNSFSIDAIYYYNYILLQTYLVDNDKVKDKVVSQNIVLLRTIANEGILPLEFSLNCIIGAIYGAANKVDEQEIYLRRACEICVKENWFGLFSKYYIKDYPVINKILYQYDPKYVDTLTELEKFSMNNWFFAHRVSQGNLIFSELSVQQNEVLFLLTYNCPLQSLAIIMGINNDELKNIFQEIMQIYHLNSLDDLKLYGESKLLEEKQSSI